MVPLLSFPRKLLRCGARRPLCPRRSFCARPLVVEALEERTLLSYTFSQIADISLSFDSSLPGRYFPGINSRGTACFWSAVRPGGEGIFTRDMEGSLGIIAITDDQLQSFPTGPLMNSAGTVAFLANLRAGGQALFTGNGGSVTRIADTTSGPFSSFLGKAPQLNDAGTAAFAATPTSGGQGIFTTSGGPPAILYVNGGLFKDFPANNVAINQAGTI